MVDVTEVQGYRTKFESQQELLQAAKIDERDRDAIERWVVHLRANDPEVESLGTVVNHLNRIRLAAERGHLPLVEYGDVEDVNALKLHLEDRHGLSEGTLRNYMKAVRKFFLWHRESEDIRWPEDITVGSPPDRQHNPDEEITPDELDAMLDAASQFDTASRDKALIALLRDTGLRIGAVLSFQIKHVDFEDRRGTVTINERAHVKDASGPKPITWSRGYVANWLDVHPRPDDDEAALIHKSRQWTEDEHGALTQQYAGDRIKTIAEEAGLDADRIHAHLFRGTAISEWIRSDDGEQKIKHRVDWVKDSSEFETYSLVSDEEMNEVIFDDLDIGESRRPEETGTNLDECRQCGTPLRGTERFCPGCAGPLTQEAAESAGDVEDKTFESTAADDGSEGDFFAEFRERFNNDPEFRERVVGNHELS